MQNLKNYEIYQNIFQICQFFLEFSIDSKIKICFLYRKTSFLIPDTKSTIVHRIEFPKQNISLKVYYIRKLYIQKSAENGHFLQFWGFIPTINQNFYPPCQLIPATKSTFYLFFWIQYSILITGVFRYLFRDQFVISMTFSNFQEYKFN